MTGFCRNCGQADCNGCISKDTSYLAAAEAVAEPTITVLMSPPGLKLAIAAMTDQGIWFQVEPIPFNKFNLTVRSKDAERELLMRFNTEAQRIADGGGVL